MDFTAPAAVRTNLELYVRAGVRFVLGTTGATAADLAALERARAQDRYLRHC